MKNILVIFNVLILALVTSCTSEMEEPLTFDVNIESTDSCYMDQDTLFVYKTIPIEFSIHGNAEQIAFYDGVAGKEYGKDSLSVKGLGIKAITDRLEKYTFRYNIAGVYMATFVGIKANFAYHDERVVDFCIKVVN